ncbi:MAG: hypothetical protein JWM77_2232 [Rhodospirillales bacterium]|jgi:hypothetical protein|nr:hypothetical protein [Rhodospirillales bacterium]
MKVYVGDRTIDGVSVRVNGAPLDPRTDLARFTPNGFEWSYEGQEPRQLALALLADHLGDGKEALKLADIFMRNVVANFDNEWELRGEDIDAALRVLRPQVTA